MPFPLQAVGGKVVVPGSITYNSAGSNNFIVPEYDFIRVRMVGSSGGSAGAVISDTSFYFAGGHGGDTSFNGVQVTGGGGAPNLSGGSGRAVASGGSVNTNGTNGPNGDQVTAGSFTPLPVPAGVAAQGGGGAGAAGVASDTTNVAGAQGTAPGGGPRGERSVASVNSGKSTYQVTTVTGGGQGGGYSEKTWACADAGAPAVQATLAAVVGAGGGAGANGGAAGQPGRIIIDWW